MNHKFSLGTTILLILICLAVVLIDAHRPKSEPKLVETIVERFARQTATFYDCSAINWAALDTAYYRSYSDDWSAKTDSLLRASKFPLSEACRAWHLLKNAQTHLRVEAAAVRASATRDAAKALDSLDQSFDLAFEVLIDDGYHLRAFFDAYNSVVAPAYAHAIRSLSPNK